MRAIIFYFYAPHGTSNDQVLYLRPDWKKVFGILVESLSAKRTGYPGGVLRANLNRVHHPDNTERFGANGTAGDKLVRHEVLPPRLQLSRSRTAAAPHRKSRLFDTQDFPPCLNHNRERPAWLKGLSLALRLLRGWFEPQHTTLLRGSRQEILDSWS